MRNLVLGLLLVSSSISYAQSITVQPAMPSVGVVGGNSTAGTISSTGLYTAPANLP